MVLGLSILGAAIYVYFISPRPVLYNSAPVVGRVVVLSMLVLLLYIVAAVMVLLQFDYLSALRHVRAVTFCRLALVIAVAAALRVAVSLFLNDEQSPETPRSFVANFLLLRPISIPGIFIISHAVYFGPIVIFLLLLWGRFCRAVHGFGLGLPLYVLFYVVMSINSESRHLIDCFPFFVAFAVKAVDNLNWRAGWYWFIGALCLVSSKAWMPINIASWRGSALEFPRQYYYMSHGPWMSNTMYLVQGGVVVLMAVALALTIFRGQDDKVASLSAE